MFGAGVEVLAKAGVSAKLPSGKPDPGILVAGEGNATSAVPAFVKAIAKHRHFAREVDPPGV